MAISFIYIENMRILFNIIMRIQRRYHEYVANRNTYDLWLI